MALAVVGDHLNVNILLAADHQQVVELLLLRQTHTMVGWNLVVGSGLVLHLLVGKWQLSPAQNHLSHMKSNQCPMWRGWRGVGQHHIAPDPMPINEPQPLRGSCQFYAPEPAPSTSHMHESPHRPFEVRSDPHEASRSRHRAGQLLTTKCT